MIKIEKLKIRRIYYISSIAALLLIATALSIPIYINVKNEYRRNIEQLSESIIQQKKLFLRAVIVEKISDIKQVERMIREQNPDISDEEFDSLFRESIKNMIHATELPDDGYIWINEILDYNGGDNYAIRFVHPNLVGEEGSYLSTFTSDNAGNFPYKDELDGVKEFGEVYFDYYFKKMNSDQVSHKMSYAQLYEPYNWIVATGVYLDDVDQLIQQEISTMKDTTDQALFHISLAIVISISVLVILVIAFERKFQSIIAVYVGRVQESNQKLLKEKEKLEEAYRQIESMAYTDFLTGLLNRRAMLEHIDNEVSRMNREGKTFALLLCDIDRFKNINDTFGHETGDQILKGLAAVFTRTLRREDKLCRWGGEEFLLMIINADKKSTAKTAEKLRQAVEQHTFCYKEQNHHITITIGAVVSETECPVSDLIDKADEKLYRGKNNGRNQVVI